LAGEPVGDKDMTPSEFIKTIYLGDRACKSLEIDGWNQRVRIQVDTISRIRSVSGEWEFYSEEDIEDGYLVFDAVVSASLSPPGFLPNDWISIVRVDRLLGVDGMDSPNDRFKFVLSLGAVTSKGDGQELTLEIVARSIHLEDPSRHGIAITE